MAEQCVHIIKNYGANNNTFVYAESTISLNIFLQSLGNIIIWNFTNIKCIHPFILDPNGDGVKSVRIDFIESDKIRSNLDPNAEKEYNQYIKESCEILDKIRTQSVLSTVFMNGFNYDFERIPFVNNHFALECYYDIIEWVKSPTDKITIDINTNYMSFADYCKSLGKFIKMNSHIIMSFDETKHYKCGTKNMIINLSSPIITFPLSELFVIDNRN